MKDQFKELIEQLRTTNVGKSPAYLTFLRLAKHKKAEYPKPWKIAARIKIEVNQDFVNDTELMESTVDAYVTVLNNIWKTLGEDFDYPTAQEILLTMASGMTLTYTI